MEIIDEKVETIYREFTVKKKVIQALIDLSNGVPEEYKELKAYLTSVAKTIVEKGIK